MDSHRSEGPSFHKTVVIDVVGLTRDLISEKNTPHLHRWMEQLPSKGAVIIEPSFPAVTCVPQTTYLTGKPPSEHGIIANGFFDRSFCEVRNWHQSAKLLRHKRIFDVIKEMARANASASSGPDVRKDGIGGTSREDLLSPPASLSSISSEPTVFTNCWWYCMNDPNIDFLVTPRPQYLQDGRMKSDLYTKPAGLRDALQTRLGMFPLGKFWGPLTSIDSTAWVAEASKIVDQMYNPTLSLIYLPHLDYCLQKYGPDDKKVVPKHLQEIDKVVHSLISYYQKTHPDVRVIVLSEYGISPVERTIPVNRFLRHAGYLKVRKENGGETIDYGASLAFAVADHQVAHVYIQNPKKDLEAVRELLQRISGIEHVLDAQQQNNYYFSKKRVAANDGGAYNPERSGDLLLVADAKSWFTYYYWQQDAQAPDFARCVEIHRKPGYDPAEMFVRHNPQWLGVLYLFFKLFLVYFVGLRTTVNACPLNGDMIKGSHGRIPEEDKYKPVLISNVSLSSKDKEKEKEKASSSSSSIRAEQVYDVLLESLTKN